MIPLTMCNKEVTTRSTIITMYNDVLTTAPFDK